MLSGRIPSVTGKQGAYNWALNPSLAAMIQLKLGRLLKFLPMYVHYFEVGRLTAMADAGLPFGAVLKQGYTVVAVDIYVQHKAPAFADEVLEVESYITDFHGALMTWQQAIHRRADGVLAAVAEVNGAFTRADGRPTRIPQAMRTLLEAVYVPDAVPLV